MVVDLLVAVDVVQNTGQVLLAGVGLSSPFHQPEDGLGHWYATTALFGALLADVLYAGVLVVADQGGQTLGHNHDWVSLHNVPNTLAVCQDVKGVRVVYVGHSGSSKRDHFHLLEDL